jgi:hypothetical protein
MGACDRSGRRSYRSATTTANRPANDCTRHGTSSGLCEAFSYSHRRFDADKQQYRQQVLHLRIPTIFFKKNDNVASSFSLLTESG